jgi:hypothetical protein
MHCNAVATVVQEFAISDGVGDFENEFDEIMTVCAEKAQSPSEGLFLGYSAGRYTLPDSAAAFLGNATPPLPSLFCGLYEQVLCRGPANGYPPTALECHCTCLVDEVCQTNGDAPETVCAWDGDAGGLCGDWSE